VAEASFCPFSGSVHSNPHPPVNTHNQTHTCMIRKLRKSRTTIEPQEKHILQALSFADRIGDGSLLIHCHAGISRSSAVALAIIANKLGEGKERDSVKTLKKINPHSRPNKSIVWMTDEILLRNKKLYNTAFKMMWLTN
jgi:predicted protein tyrosine phosphatase